jgi:hypothetical protein
MSSGSRRSDSASQAGIPESLARDADSDRGGRSCHSTNASPAPASDPPPAGDGTRSTGSDSAPNPPAIAPLLPAARAAAEWLSGLERGPETRDPGREWARDSGRVQRGMLCARGPGSAPGSQRRSARLREPARLTAREAGPLGDWESGRGRERSGVRARSSSSACRRRLGIRKGVFDPSRANIKYGFQEAIEMIAVSDSRKLYQ